MKTPMSERLARYPAGNSVFVFLPAVGFAPVRRGGLLEKLLEGLLDIEVDPELYGSTVTENIAAFTYAL